MPGNLLFADLSFPEIREGEDTRAALKKIENYLYLLLENLRYTLQNLEPGNFNAEEMEPYFKKLTAGLVEAKTVLSDTIITRELYADFGAVADLAVNRLRTDYDRAQRYLAGDTSPIHYIHIQNETIRFVTGTTDGVRTEQLAVDGKKFWWTDRSRRRMTAERKTGLPVMVYHYDEGDAASIRYQDVEIGGFPAVLPTMVWGYGTGVTADSGKCVFYKDQFGMRMVYTTSMGDKRARIDFQDDGFVDVTQRRASVAVNRAQQTITVAPEGADQSPIVIGYEEQGDRLSLTWPDGKVFHVEVT